jgi:hypothetical protein
VAEREHIDVVLYHCHKFFPIAQSHARAHALVRDMMEKEKLWHLRIAILEDTAQFVHLAVPNFTFGSEGTNLRARIEADNHQSAVIGLVLQCFHKHLLVFKGMLEFKLFGEWIVEVFSLLLRVTRPDRPVVVIAGCDKNPSCKRRQGLPREFVLLFLPALRKVSRHQKVAVRVLPTNCVEKSLGLMVLRGTLAEMEVTYMKYRYHNISFLASNVRLQPRRRLMLARAAVGCKPC